MNAYPHLIDAHTHLAYAAPGIAIEQAGLSLAQEAQPHRCYSVGIHPQELSRVEHFSFDRELECLEAAAAHPQAVALGEAGIDRRLPDLDLQERLFEAHIRLADRLGKPLIIHLVGAADRLMRLHRLHPHHTPWVVHGYRRGAVLARQLLSCGFCLSFGRHYHDEALLATPLPQLLIETDEATDLPPEGIEALYRRAAQLRGVPAAELKQAVAANLQRILAF